MNIQDECAKIHNKYGTTEMANYKIQLLFESYLESQLKEERGKRLKKICIKFFYWWYNQPGNDTEQGFDKWWNEIGKNLKP